MEYSKLLKNVVMVMLITQTVRSTEEGCAKCYRPLYDEESLTTLIRVHTNISPKCFDASQLLTCQEDGKTYWITKNTANFRQRLLGECPAGEPWFCFEQVSNSETQNDIIKEKQIIKTPKKNEFEIPTGKNLFIDLVERISKELNLTNCWVCGSTKMTEIWPWEGISLGPLEILKWRQTTPNFQRFGQRVKEKWELEAKVIGEECIMRTGRKYTTPVGKMACKRYIIIKDLTTRWVPQEPNRYWSIEKKEKGCIYHEGYNLHECAKKGANPFHEIKEIAKYWENPEKIEDNFWVAPDHLFWICGDIAYTTLPGNWTGSCTIGIIKPSFFLLPKEAGSILGIPLYDNLRKTNRTKRETIDMGSSQVWKKKIWTPQEIIRVYGPATWAQDGSWGYRTPIYMLNRIIRLQAVLEIVSNNTALALDHISTQLAQTRSVIYQIRLAVDYLLADEGGICGKFNSSECCLEIDDKSSVIKNISKEIRKIAYVGVQEWTPLINSNWWDNFFSFKGEWWKKLGFLIVTAISSLLFLPCLLPCLIKIIRSTLQASTQISKTFDQEKAKVMVVKSQEKEQKIAKKAYDQYQKVSKFYFKEEEKVTC